jgi:hypothetical protein
MSKAWFRLAVVDAVATIGGFARLHRFIRRLAPRQRRQTRTVEEIRATIDRAAVYYPRELYCLRRSAALTWQLRAYGYPAELIIGACVTPFLAHAWVELDGRIINDDEQRIRGTYAVLERC